MRTPAINDALEITISRPRLQKYLAATGGNLDRALRLYEENLRLSESFYTPLQAVEICLRNHIHREFTVQYGVDWYQNGAPGFNLASEKMIGDALAEVSGNPDINDVVAELKFAFWVGVLGPHYDATLWRKCLHRAFRSGGGKPRSIVHHRFNAIRRFRNRIMHHEPIFQKPLQQFHDEIVEAIGWMCRDTAAWAAHHSRFDDVIAHRGR